MPSTADWSSPAFLAEATDWIDEQLLAHGLERTGRVEQPHLRPWATALRAGTTGGPVWLKAPGSGTVSEVPLYAILARVVPEHVLVPLAIDTDRGWVLLPDGGPTLGARNSPRESLVGALAVYGRMQRALEPHVEEMLAGGVADMRPAAMPERLEEALAVVAAHPDGGDLHERLAAERPRILAWFDELAASPIPASLDHNDLHMFNVLGAGGDGYKFYDWGDAVVAHPFASARVPLGIAPAARDPYLAAFADLAPHDELIATLELACRVGKVTRVLIWDRSLAAAREQGLEIPNDWLTGPLESAASILDEDYLGGAWTRTRRGTSRRCRAAGPAGRARWSAARSPRAGRRPTR